MDIVESIERYLAGTVLSKGERTRLVRARDEIVKLRRGKQEQWQGLTVEKRLACEQSAKGNYVALVRAVETKLKEKNT